jgi:YHS domain-containing protein
MIRKAILMSGAVVFLTAGLALAGGCGSMKDGACQMKKGETCVDQTVSTNQAKVGDTVCCPVMGTKFKVKKDSLYAEIDGRKVYVCCPGCIDPLKKDPGKYLKKKESPEKKTAE